MGKTILNTNIRVLDNLDYKFINPLSPTFGSNSSVPHALNNDKKYEKKMIQPKTSDED